MLARDQGFVAQCSVEVQFLAPFRFDILRHVPQDQHDFVRHVKSGVGVVAFGGLARRGQSVAGKNHLAFELAI